MPSFGDNLKQLRTERKLSQTELANLVKVHPTHVSRYERGQANPTVDVVRKIAEALNVSSDQLIYGDADQMAKDKIRDKDLLMQFNRVEQLPEAKKLLVKEFLDAFLFKTDLKEKLTA